MDSFFTSPFLHKLASKEQMFTFSYSCQRCCQPLKLISPLPNLDRSDKQISTDQTVVTNSNTNEVNKKDYINISSEEGIHGKIMIPTELTESQSDFVFVNLPLDLNQTLKINSIFHNIMSGQSDVDHPLCKKCTDNLFDQMDQQLRIAEDDCKVYKDFLENMQVDSDEDNIEKLTKELEDLQETEAQLEKELSAIEEKEKETKQLLKSLEEDYETLQREEDKQWKEYFLIKRHQLISEDSYDSVYNQLLYAQAKLDRLNKTSVFDATFHIWHKGPFGTINKFRLGRLITVPVEWSEINAAWGQTVLLLHSLAKRMNFTFTRYRLVPYGNHSYIESLENKSKDFPLYCLGGSKFMMSIKFDLAMVAFLDCLTEFKNHVEQIDKSFSLPYQMEKGKVKDSSYISYSIKAHLNSEEHWTRALKLMLTNLKWALAWVSIQIQ